MSICILYAFVHICNWCKYVFTSICVEYWWTVYKFLHVPLYIHIHVPIHKRTFYLRRQTNFSFVKNVYFYLDMCEKLKCMYIYLHLSIISAYLNNIYIYIYFKNMPMLNSKWYVYVQFIFTSIEIWLNGFNWIMNWIL
jgi:hypothetical protein